MKKVLWAILAASIFVSCKKDKVGVQAQVIGKWELHRTYGGFINPPDSVYKAGNGNILQFNADSTYKTYSAGALSDSGKFHVVRHAYNLGGTYYDELYFNSYSSYYTLADATVLDVVTVSGNILTIKPVTPDVGTTEYDKISN